MLPQVAAIFFLILAISPEAKWRLRDPSASAAANADLQTLVELGFYAGIGAWALWHLLRGWSSERYRLQTIGPAVLVLVAATLLIVSTGVLAVSSRSMTRSVQYGVMTVMTMVVFWESRGNTQFFEAFWRLVRRGFIVFAILATAVTAVVPSFDGSFDDAGIRRYGWMEIHPITTAGMLGVALIAIFGAYLGLPDRLAFRRHFRILAFGLSAAFLGLLVLTNSRGATIATGLALVMLVTATPRKRLRRFAMLGLIVMIAVALAYFTSEGGSSQLQTFVNRGQTTEQLLSLSQRTTLFEIGMGYFAESPVFGHGYMIPGTLLRTHFVWAGHAHNVALEIMMGLGLVGLSVFILLIGLIIRGIWLGAHTATGRLTGIPAEASALITLILVQGVISDGFGGPVGWEVGLLMLTVLMSDLGRHWRTQPMPAHGGALVSTPDVAAPLPPAPVRIHPTGAAPMPVTGPPQAMQIDVNTATAEQLTALPGIGRRMATRIITYRSDRGGFTSVDDLLGVRGIGRIVMARLRPQVTVVAPQGRMLRLRRW